LIFSRVLNVIINLFGVHGEIIYLLFESKKI
jgi:hypothetical protein